MNSNGWKIGIFAIAAVVALSACGPKKKKAHAGSPYAGIWVDQDNISEYSQFRTRLNAGDYQFCRNVYANIRRYGNSDLSVKVMLVQGNGEVFNYSAVESFNSVGFREANFLGTVNGLGQFTPGQIGPDGRVTTITNYGFDARSSAMSFAISPSNHNVMRVMSSEKTFFLARHPRAVMDEYVGHVSVCLQKWKETRRSSSATVDKCEEKDIDPKLHPECLEDGEVRHHRGRGHDRADGLDGR